MEKKEKLRKDQEEELKRLIRENPQDSNKIFNLIIFYFESDSKNDWENAVKLLDKHRKLFAKDPEFHRITSILYMRMEDVEKAEEIAINAAEKYVRFNPDSPSPYIFLGYVYWWYKELDKAIETTDKALEIAQDIDDEYSQIMSKANLAYYYADGELADLADTAIEYAEKAHNYSPTPANIDTLWYVKMKFAQTIPELEEAYNAFVEILEMVGAIREIIIEHIEECRKKIEQFSA